MSGRRDSCRGVVHLVPAMRVPPVAQKKNSVFYLFFSAQFRVCTSEKPFAFENRGSLDVNPSPPLISRPILL